VKLKLPTWAWILLSIGAVVALAVVAVMGFIVWAYFDLKKFKTQEDTHDLRGRVEKHAADYLARRPRVALVIAVIQNDQTHWLGFGQISATNTNPPDASTIFEIGSVTKVFTSIALAQLVNDGKLKLDDRIGKLLPAEVSLPAELQPITLVQLATHTAGLPRLPANLATTNLANPYACYTSKELYAYLGAAKLDRPPGRKHAYSNLGVGLLGHILELRAGVPYEQLVRERILDPLGLTNTAITLSPDQQARLTPGHDAKGNVVSPWDFAVLAPAGALRSCAGDLLPFIQANLAPTNHPTVDAALEFAHKLRYESLLHKLGLCWHIREAPGLYQFHWHNGGTGGYASFIGFDRANQTGVVLLSNYGDALAGDHALDDIGFNLLKLVSRVSWE
jgi:serine-type D-Ala-D-Ala carboxypeptidase/endopeptidase